jgi:hypothetical protein
MFCTLTLLMIGRQNPFGLADWRLIFKAVKEKSNLREIADVEWSASMLAPDTKEFTVVKSDLGKKFQIMALNSLLPRIAGTLTTLKLRCAVVLGCNWVCLSWCT